jgi:hypothetical protein
MGGVSVNGSMPFSNALLDGASTSSPMSNNVINTPIFDTLGEVKMSSSAFSAQYGGGGMVYNQISKGGSNQFHGMAYDYFKNTALNASPFGFNGVSFKTPQHFNDFGFNIGDDYQLVNYTQYVEYLQRLDKESDRMTVVEIGKTEEGRPELMAIITTVMTVPLLNLFDDKAVGATR